MALGDDSIKEIRFKVPEWAYGKHIYIFANQELLGQMQATSDKNHNISYKPLEIKPDDGRCTGCGDCCQMLSTKDSFLIKTIRERVINFKEGACPFATDKGCALKSFTPFSCLRSVCSHIGRCTEKLIEVK